MIWPGQADRIPTHLNATACSIPASTMPALLAWILLLQRILHGAHRPRLLLARFSSPVPSIPAKFVLETVLHPPQLRGRLSLGMLIDA